MVHVGPLDQSPWRDLPLDPETTTQLLEPCGWLPDDGPYPLWLAQAMRDHVWPERAPIAPQEFYQKLRGATITV